MAWAIVFPIFALITGLLGFGGLKGGNPEDIMKSLSILFLFFFLINLLSDQRRNASAIAFVIISIILAFAGFGRGEVELITWIERIAGFIFFLLSGFIYYFGDHRQAERK